MRGNFRYGGNSSMSLFASELDAEGDPEIPLMIGGKLYAGRGCACRCGKPVRDDATYAPGHDARHRDELIDLLVGRGTPRDRARRINKLIDGLKR